MEVQLTGFVVLWHVMILMTLTFYVDGRKCHAAIPGALIEVPPRSSLAVVEANRLGSRLYTESFEAKTLWEERKSSN